MVLQQVQQLLEPNFLWVPNTGWIAIGAFVTAVMAAATAYLAFENRSEARAAADTVKEIQKDRELTFRPYISWKATEGLFVIGANFGKGPALNTVFCVVQDDEQTWFANTELADFSPEQAITGEDRIELAIRKGPPPEAPTGWPRYVARWRSARISWATAIGFYQARCSPTCGIPAKRRPHG